MSMQTPSPLRRWRDAANLTQEEAARRAGCSQSTISLIEAGSETSVGLLRKLVAIYGVSAQEAGVLLTGPDDSEPPAAVV